MTPTLSAPLSSLNGALATGLVVAPFLTYFYATGQALGVCVGSAVGNDPQACQAAGQRVTTAVLIIGAMSAATLFLAHRAEQGRGKLGG